MRYLVSIIALAVGVAITTGGSTENMLWKEWGITWGLHAAAMVIFSFVVAKAMKAHFGIAEVVGVACASVLALALGGVAPIPSLVMVGLAMFFFAVIVLETEAFVGLGVAIVGILTAFVVTEFSLVAEVSARI